MSDYHISVLLQEAVQALQVKPDKKYIDATLGGGGHTLAIANVGGKVLGIDVDQDALAYVKENDQFSRLSSSITLQKGNFSTIDTLAKNNGFDKVAGILFDLGVSSHQFDEGSRGFSFRMDAPLDMRMDISLGVKATDLVNGLHKGELYDLFTKFGEEPFAKRIAEGIVKAREIEPITTTSQLAKIAERAYPRGFHKIHPATKIFQALRIAVNDELNSIEEALPKSLGLLEEKGRIVVITFHSLEDRIVKRLFDNFAQEGKGKVITQKPIIPSDEEIAQNARSRSAKLRIFEKL